MRKKHWYYKLHAIAKRIDVAVYVLIYAYIGIQTDWKISLCIAGIHLSHFIAYHIGKHKHHKTCKTN